MAVLVLFYGASSLCTNADGLKDEGNGQICDKITLAVFSTYPPTNCGIAEFTHNMLCAIKENEKRSVEIHVFSISKEKHARGRREEAPEKREAEGSIAVSKIWLKKSQEKEQLEKIAEEINAKEYSCLFLQHEIGLLHDFNNFSHFLEKISTKTKIFTFVHTGSPYIEFSQRHALQRVALFSDYVVALGWKVKYAMTHFYGIPGFKVVYFPHGVYKPEIKIEKPKEEKVVFLMAGLMRHSKGVFEAVDAINILKKRRKAGNIRLSIVGKDILGGKLAKAVMQKVKSCGLSKHVTWNYGYHSLSEITIAHLKADVFLAPFNVEVPMSGTISFAMACGLPVIATPFGFSGEALGLPASVPEYIATSFEQDKQPGCVRYTDRGAIIPYSNIESLVSAMEKLAADKKKRRMMGRNARRIFAKLSWKSVAKAIAGFIRTGVNSGDFMENIYKKSMVKTSAKWTERAVIDLNRRRVQDIPDGAYCAYMDSFVVINVFSRKGKITSLGARFIEYAPGTRAGVASECFIHASRGRAFLKNGAHSLSKRFRGFVQYIYFPKGAAKIFEKDDGTFQVHTPNIVFEVAREKKALSLKITRASRFGAARGVLGHALVKRFSGRHRDQPDEPASTWRLQNWKDNVFNITTNLKRDFWSKGAFYGMPSFTEGSLGGAGSSGSSISIDSNGLFEDTEKGKNTRAEIFKNWCASTTKISIHPPVSQAQSLRRQTFEEYVIKQLIKEAKDK